MYLPDSNFENFMKLARKNRFKLEDVFLKSPSEFELAKVLDGYASQKYGIPAKFITVGGEIDLTKAGFFAARIPYMVEDDGIIPGPAFPTSVEYKDLLVAHRKRILVRFDLNRHDDIWLFLRDSKLKGYELQNTEGTIDYLTKSMRKLIG